MGPKEVYMSLARLMYDAGYLAPGVGIVEVGYLIQEWDTDPDEEHVEEND